MFANLIGQASSTSLLREALLGGTLAPAILFEGAPATGKLTAALELGRILNCRAGEDPGCRCPSCGNNRALQDPHVLLLGARDFAAEIAAASAALARSDTLACRDLFVRAVRTLTRRFDDLLWTGSESRLRRLRPRVEELEERLEGLRTAGTAELAAELARAANLEAVPVNAVRAIESWARVATIGIKVIIVEVRRRLPEPASNALLRTVEEPPQRTQFIFTAPSPQALIPTLLSRLARYRFGERSAVNERRVISEVFSDPDANAPTLADYLTGSRSGPSSGEGPAGIQRAATRFCDAAFAGGDWDGDFLPADRDEGFTFLQSCAEHLRSLLRSPARVVEVRRIERWYRFLDDAAWRMKTMNMNPEATIADIARGMAAGSEPPMRRW